MKRVAFALLTLSLPVPAWAWQPSESRWNPASLPIPYRVNVASVPPSLGSAVGLAAVNDGFAAWAAPTCTRWRASNVGNTTVTRAVAGDRENSILWISGAWPAELGAVNITIGVTTPVYRVGGYFIDADIQFNNVGFTWNTTGRGGVDAQSIATHEEGHFLGLDHTSVRSAVMFASYMGGLVRTLSADDIAGVCALYPSGGPVPDAGVASDAGVMPPPMDPCARATSCAGCTPLAGCGWCAAQNLCMSGTSTGPTGASCGGPWAWVPTQCPAPSTDAGAPPDASSTDPCARFTSCGACTPVNGCGWCGATGQCVSGTQTGPVRGTCASGYAWLPQECPTTQPTGTAQFGEPCRQPADCASGGICVGGSGIAPFCTRVCVDDCTCPRGYRCGARITTGQMVCVPGSNTCDTGTIDAGTVDAAPVPVDAPSRPPDASMPSPDASRPIDAPMPSPDASRPPTPDANELPEEDVTVPSADTSPGQDVSDDVPRNGFSPSTSSSGCGCATQPVTHSLRAVGALAAVVAWALRRRRRAVRT